MTFPVEKVRADFPILQREVNGLPLAYLDSAASAQKPNQVIDAESAFYRHGYAAVHRGIHTLSAQATESMENVRKQASRFINARSAEELVFVRGTTEGINLVANSWGTENIRAGDNIIISEMEHHANIVPWQMLCERKGAELRVIPLHPDGTLRLETLAALFDDRTRLLAITHVSNVLGTENPLPDMIALARQHGAKVLVDGAQAVMHHAVDVQALDCDFYVFSGHKLYGPTGIGILYVKEALLQEMPPWEGGGSMISTVSLTQGTTWAKAPWRFEAGTPNTGGIIGLGAAIDYVTSLGLDKIGDYEQMLMRWSNWRRCLISRCMVRRSGWASSRLIWVNTMLMTSAAFLIITVSRYERGITARCRSWPGMACRQCAGLRWRCITPMKKWTDWWQD